MNERSTRARSRAERRRLLREKTLADVAGPRGLRMWKTQALDEVLAIAERADRMEVLQADLHGDFEIFYRIDMPVPCWPQGHRLPIADFAIFHLIYPDQWRAEPPPGWGPLGIVTPPDIFHPNAKPSLRGALCLGQLPAGIPPKELVLLGYYLVSLQDVSLDERDPHGVLNPLASEFYRCNPHYVPLTRAGLFDEWRGAQEQGHA